MKRLKAVFFGFFPEFWIQDYVISHKDLNIIEILNLWNEKTRGMV
jgi:hypothetical protein